MRQVGGLLWVLQFPPSNKTGCHDINEILLKVALTTIKQINKLIQILNAILLVCESVD
jgi:hypothetical protein